MKVEQIAQRQVFALDSHATLDTAIQQLSEHDIRHLLVTDDGAPAGMLSERDVLLHAFAEDTENRTGDIQIRTIMTEPIVALTAEDEVQDAARLMLDKQLSALPLIKDGNAVGLVTRIDLLKRFTDDDAEVPSTTCRQQAIVEQMSTDVHSIDPDDSTKTAIRMMVNGHIRHIPVVRDGILFGIVSDRDVLRGGPRRDGSPPTCVAELRSSHHPEIRGIMSKQPIVLEPTATLADAAEQMVSQRIGAIPIVDENKLVGLLTDTDLLVLLHRGE